MFQRIPSWSNQYLPADVVNTVDPDGVLDSMSDVTLATGEDNLDQDFGYVEDLGSIGDPSS